MDDGVVFPAPLPSASLAYLSCVAGRWLCLFSGVPPLFLIASSSMMELFVR